MDKSIVSFRIDESLYDSIKEWAASENRTVSNFMESILYEEARRRSGVDVSLYSLCSKIDQLVDLLSVTKKKPTEKTKRSSRSQEELDEILALELPPEIEFEWWRDFVMMRETSKKPKITPLTVNAAKLALKKCRQAIANGWSMEHQFDEATAREWAMPVYDQHLNTRANGKEVVVKPKLSTSEVSAKKVKLLNSVGMVGHNRDRFVDYALMVQFIDTAFATDQPLEMNMLSTMLDKFYKSGNKEKCNQWVRDLIETQNILDDDGNFIAMRGFQ